jgi:hypothetical protein
VDLTVLAGANTIWPQGNCVYRAVRRAWRWRLRRDLRHEVGQEDRQESREVLLQWPHWRASVSHAKTADTATNATNLGGAGPNDYQTASAYTQSSTAKAITGTVETIGSPIKITTTGTKRVIASARCTR